MGTNTILLNKLFTKTVFKELLESKHNSIYNKTSQQYSNGSKGNNEIIKEIYSYMNKEYRNEYIYINTLLNKLLLGKHSVKTTTALTQIPIHKSKADFILINGKAVVYEIKTELDSFERLNTQINDYFRAFDHVYVVVGEKMGDKVEKYLKDEHVGIYVLTGRNKMSLKREAKKNIENLNYISIFKILRKYEYENIIYSYYNELPDVSEFLYYDECLKLFCNIPMDEAYKLFLKELKLRNKVTNEFQMVPVELKSLVYFSNYKEKDYYKLQEFLSEINGG